MDRPILDLTTVRFDSTREFFSVAGRSSSQVRCLSDPKDMQFSVRPRDADINTWWMQFPGEPDQFNAIDRGKWEVHGLRFERPGNAHGFLRSGVLVRGIPSVQAPLLPRQRTGRIQGDRCPDAATAPGIHRRAPRPQLERDTDQLGREVALRYRRSSGDRSDTVGRRREAKSPRVENSTLSRRVSIRPPAACLSSPPRIGGLCIPWMVRNWPRSGPCGRTT